MPRDAPDEFILFFDANFGQYVVPNAVRAAGTRYEALLDHFAADAPDVEWLPRVGENRWFVVTKDEAIGRRFNEVEALRAAQVGAFVLASTDLTGPEMAEIVVKVLPKMRAFVAQNQRPFIAKFYKDGRLIAWK